jgi:hypothetical protein
MTPSEARYEFRVWAEHLDDAARRLRSASEHKGVRETSEIYLVSKTPSAANPKVRDDRLDVKVLRSSLEGFEQWTVRFKAEFPVGAALLEAELFPLLGIPIPRLECDEYTFAELLTEVVADLDDLAAVEVTKVRDSYITNGCLAEVADVTVAGRPFQTIAVESVDIDVLRETRRMLQLEGDRNVSYPEFIRGIFGWGSSSGEASGG